MPVRRNEIIREIEQPTVTGAEALARYYRVPSVTDLDIWCLEKIAGRRANAGDWTVTISTSTLIALLAAIKGARDV